MKDSEEVEVYRTDIAEKYYKKFGKRIGIPINGMPPNRTMKEMFEECEKCIKENREFDGGKFFGTLPDDCIE